MTRHWPTCSTLDSILYSRTSARFCRDDTRKCERDVAKFNIEQGVTWKWSTKGLNKFKSRKIYFHRCLYWFTFFERKKKKNCYFCLIFIAEEKKKVACQLKFQYLDQPSRWLICCCLESQFRFRDGIYRDAEECFTKDRSVWKRVLCETTGFNQFNRTNEATRIRENVKLPDYNPVWCSRAAKLLILVPKALTSEAKQTSATGRNCSAHRSLVARRNR